MKSLQHSVNQSMARSIHFEDIGLQQLNKTTTKEVRAFVYHTRKLNQQRKAWNSKTIMHLSMLSPRGAGDPGHMWGI